MLQFYQFCALTNTIHDENCPTPMQETGLLELVQGLFIASGASNGAHGSNTGPPIWVVSKE